MKKNIITFEAQNEHVFNVRERPVPASKMVPDWWKEIPKYSNKNNKLELTPVSSITVKQCAPTVDMLTSGYIITLWSDILVSQVNGYPYLKWISQEPVADLWSEIQTNNFEVPNGFSNSIFKYMHGWNIITPPGWSTLFMHPFGYQNLPIRSISGIVDTDILKTAINCPFFVKENFEGVIPKGTPMVQLIPFQRADWVSDFTNPGPSKKYFEDEKLFTKLYGYYSSLRSRKNYK